MRIRRLVTIVLALGVISVATGAGAKTISGTALFATKGQSVFNSGPAVAFDTGRQRLGPGPIDRDDTVGSISDECPYHLCRFGARAGADVHLNVGLDYAVRIDTGSLDAQYPVNYSIVAPDDFSTKAGTQFTLRSSYDIAGFNSSVIKRVLGQEVSARLQANGPTVQAFVDLDARFKAFVGAEACGSLYCVGPSIEIPQIDASRPIASINFNNDRILRIGDFEVTARQRFSTLDGNVTAAVNIPNLDAVSSKANGSTATVLRTFARDNAVVLDANLGAIIGKALGIPLVGNIGGIGYNLVSANAGISIDLRQTLTLALQAIETYTFLSPVRQVFADGSLGVFTKTLSVPLGQDLTLRSNALSLGVIPVTSLVATLSNLTQLVVMGNASIQALGASIFGLDIGPLFDTGDLGFGRFAIDLFDETFRVPFNPVTGLPFNIRQSLPLDIAYVNGYQALTTITPDQAHPGVYNVDIRAVDLDCFVRLCVAHVADGSPVTFASDGSLVALGTIDGATLAPNNPGVLGTDASQVALLQSVGFTGARPAFDVPIGAPNPFAVVPEPATWMMFIIGFGSVGVIRRRRHLA